MLLASTSYAQTTDAGDQHPDLIYDCQFHLPEALEQWYNLNHTSVNPFGTWTLAGIYKTPDRTSEKRGDLIALYDSTQSNFVLRFTNNGKQVVREVSDVGDWGYGIHLHVINYAGDFVKLPDAYFGGDAWLEVKGLNAITASFKGEIVSLCDVEATGQTTGKQVILPCDNYLVEDIKNGRFVIRKSVPTDMPCGDILENSENLEALPRYYLQPLMLKTKNGDFHISLAYPRVAEDHR